MAGIAFLRRLLMKQAMKKSEDASGILSLNKGLANDVDTTVKKWIESAKKQGQDIDKMGEQEIKYIVELNKPKAAPHTLEELVEKLGLNDPKKNKFLQKEGEVIDMTGKKIDTSQPILGGKNVPEVSGIDELLKSDFNKAAGVTDVITDTVTKIKIMEPVAAMKEANLVVGRKGIYKNLTKEQSQKILKDTDDWIFQRDPDDLYDYNKKRPFRDDPDPEDFAHGGRTGSGLNYLLGEDDQNSRVPYAGGGPLADYNSRDPRWINPSLNLKSSGPYEQLKATDPNSTLMGQQGPTEKQYQIEGKFKVGDLFSTMPPTTELGSKNVQQHSTDPQYQQMLASTLRGGQPSTNTPDWSTAHGGAFKGLDMTGFKPTRSAQQDVMNFSINGNKVQGMNSAYGGSVREFLNSTGQGDAFSGSGLTPLGGTPLPSSPDLGGITTLNGRPANIDNQGQPGPNDGGLAINHNQMPPGGFPVPEVPGAIQQPMPGDTSFGVMKAFPNLNNEFFPTPSYDTPEVSEEQKITDPYQRAGGYKKQPATTPEEEVRNRENTVAQAFGAQPGALSQALGLAEGGRIGLKKGSKSWTDRIAGWTGGKNIMAGEIGLETWDLLNNLLQSGGLYAEGGRTGFGIGGLSRRAFLKLMGGAAAGTAAAKTGLLSIFKGGATKSVIKDLASVPIKAGADGMPLWFKPLVNKVIKEGDDVTKKFATQERQIVHQSTLPDSKTPVTVTQDITSGNVSVDIGMGKHGFSEGHLGQPVRLEYRASEVIEPTIKKGKVTSKGTKTKEEFNVEEAEFTGGHPENIKFEETISEKFGSHGSNFDEVEKFATGAVKKIKKASGGRVPLGGGGDPGTSSAEEVREAWKDYLKEKEKGTFRGSWQEWQPIWIRANLAQGGRVPLAEGTTPSTEQLQQYYEEIEKQKERERIQRQLYEQRFGGPGPVLEAASGGIAGMLGE